MEETDIKGLGKGGRDWHKTIGRVEETDTGLGKGVETDIKRLEGWKGRR